MCPAVLRAILQFDAPSSLYRFHRYETLKDVSPGCILPKVLLICHFLLFGHDYLKNTCGLGIKNSALERLKSYILERTQIVTISSDTSAALPLVCSVPQ